MKKTDPVNLKRLFPRSARFIFRDSFGWFALYAAVVTAAAVLDRLTLNGSKALGKIAPDLHDSLLGLFLGATIVLTVKIIHSLALHLRFNFEFFEDRLLISHGVLLRRQEELFLDKVVDVYVSKRWSDVFLGLSVVGFVVLGKTDIVITGYSARTARRLQRRLISLIENNKNGLPEAEAEEKLVVNAAR